MRLRIRMIKQPIRLKPRGIVIEEIVMRKRRGNNKKPDEGN